jgi:hypothetical protein
MTDYRVFEDPSSPEGHERPEASRAASMYADTRTAQKGAGARRLSAVKIWLAGLLAAPFSLAACSSSPPPITAHGTLMVETGLLSGLTAQSAYPDITDGSQVTVTDSSGTVIGSGDLSYSEPKTLELVLAASAKMGQNASTVASALSQDVAVYTFTVSGLPGGEQRYGIKAGQNRGTIWFTASQMKSGPQLTLGSVSL